MKGTCASKVHIACWKVGTIPARSNERAAAAARINCWRGFDEDFMPVPYVL